MPLLAAVPYHTFPDFQLGPLTIRTFGLMVALGIIVGAMIGAQYVGNRGLDPEAYTNLATKVALVGLVGARVTWVLSHLDAIQSPLDVIAVWEGGVQFSGGLLFGAAAGWWWSRRRWNQRERWALLDGTAIGLAVGLAIGRIGCMAVGEHFGPPTTFMLGMTYRGGGTVEAEPAIGETIHNTAFYEFLHLLVLLAIIAVVVRRAGNRNQPLVPGTIGGLFLTWYGVGRFVTDFARTNDATVAGLTGAQWASVALVLLGGWLLATGTRRVQALAAGERDDATADVTAGDDGEEPAGPDDEATNEPPTDEPTMDEPTSIESSTNDPIDGDGDPGVDEQPASDEDQSGAATSTPKPGDIVSIRPDHVPADERD